MSIVKLALSGLAGIETSRVDLGGALVVYDPQQLTPEQMARAINAKTPFEARVVTDRAYDPAQFQVRRKQCGWWRWFC